MQDGVRSLIFTVVYVLVQARGDWSINFWTLTPLLLQKFQLLLLFWQKF